MRNNLITIMAVAGLLLMTLLLTGCSQPGFVASVGPTAQTYVDDDGVIAPGDTIPRGTEIKVLKDTALGPDGEKLVAIKTEDFNGFLEEANIASDISEIVLEKEIFVRTPATIYAEATGPAIAGFAPKASKLEIIDCDTPDANGVVNKYHVRLGETEGYVYGKYMVYDEKTAKKNCNDNGAYDMAKDAKYPMQLYGGKATNLDYYPNEPVNIDGNEFCTDARAMYLHAGATVKDKYFKLAKKSGVNAVVINIDGGTLAYKSPVAKKLCPSAYKDAHYSVEKYQAAVKKYQDAGIYTIGRIVAFNDPHYAKDNKKACIKSGGKSTEWVSAYSRDAWEYKVSLALEAIELMGFNEIQFDYVRFPETAYQMSASGSTDFRNKYKEEKAQAIQNFCFYATDTIHEAGAYVSVDVFGESSNGYVTAYGQYWPAISNVVDAISSMPYTDHHGENDTWTDPYPTLYKWAKKSASMQKHIPTPACPRTWITGYNTPHWNPTVTYDYDKLRVQVKALKDADLDGGFIPWNSNCDYSKYKQYKKIWKK
ncbi:MAG: hypothetical protein KBS66_08330 [Eubacterium sp.]|nr:hypothetical protein [Candidatus Colimonas fimequi]